MALGSAAFGSLAWCWTNARDHHSSMEGTERRHGKQRDGVICIIRPGGTLIRERAEP